MPRYYFNLRHGPSADELAVDPEGDELDNLAAAHAYALASARDLIARTRMGSIRDWFVCTFEVVDETAALLLIVPFSDTIQNREELD